jgi:hypothetical protein
VIEEFASLPAEGNFSCITPSKQWNSDIEWISAADESRRPFLPELPF